MEVGRGTLYQPEDIALMKTVLDEADTILPAHRRTSAMTTTLAARILSSVAKGERDPVQLRRAALLETADERSSGYNLDHDLSRLKITVWVTFSYALMLLAALAAYLAVRWMAGVYY